MSYESWHNYGYGIITTKLEIDSVERIEALLSLAPEYQTEIRQWFEECEITEPTVDDYLEFDQDYNLGIATILRIVIQEAEKVEFLACDDCHCQRFLMYPKLYPWQMQESDRNVTKERVEEILKKYVSIVSDTELEIDYQEAENGG